jgi:large subunit ribosomal protein L24
MAKSKIKAGDTVLVHTGKDKGLRGTVLKVYGDVDRILVEGVNRVVRHTKVAPGQGGSRAGGLITQEASIHISNVKLVDSDSPKKSKSSAKDA